MDMRAVATALMLAIGGLCAAEEQMRPIATETIDPNNGRVADATKAIDPNNDIATDAAEAIDQNNNTAAEQITLEQEIEQYQIAAENQESLTGPYDAGLSEMYYGLAKTYQNANLHENAIKAFENSMQIQRVNSGIYSLDQAPMLRGIIKSQQALGRWDDTSLNYNQLLWLYARTYGEDDLRLLPVLSEVSNWHLNAFHHLDSKDAVPHLILSHSIADSAVNLTARALGANSLRLVGLLRSIALTSYYMASIQQNTAGNEPTALQMANRMSTWPTNEENKLYDSYRNGRNAYERIVDILYNNPESSLSDKAGAYAELGDWFLLFGQQNSAMAAYQKAHAVYEGSDEPEKINKIFGTPLLLPVVEQEYSTLDPLTKSSKPVIADIEISSGGKVGNIDVIDKEKLGEKLRRKAVRFFKSSKFRPRFVDGQPVSSKIRLTINVAAE